MLVTDRRRLALASGVPPGTATAVLKEQVCAAARAGVDFVQLREPDLDSRSLCEMAAELVGSLRGTAARLLVNDRVDVALLAHAAGVHLKARGVPPSRARELVGPGFLVGRSVHDRDEITACADDCDYLVVGTVFPTRSKPASHPVIGIAGLRAAAADVRVPVLAIGGIEPPHFADLARTGARGIAAIGLFIDAFLSGAPALEALVASAADAFGRAPF